MSDMPEVWPPCKVKIGDRVCILSGGDADGGRGKIGFIRCLMPDQSYEDLTWKALVCDGGTTSFEWAYFVDHDDLAVIQ